MLGTNSLSETNMIFVICSIIIVINTITCLASRVAVLHNTEELAELEAHKKKQEDMMNSIVTVGTSVNESTQSIHALIEEMTEATGCVSQAMGDITVSMESTVASIQEQASMTGRIQDIIADTVSIADALTNISQSSGKNVETGQALVSNIVSQTEEVESENKLVKKNMTAGTYAGHVKNYQHYPADLRTDQSSRLERHDRSSARRGSRQGVRCCRGGDPHALRADQAIH